MVSKVEEFENAVKTISPHDNDMKTIRNRLKTIENLIVFASTHRFRIVLYRSHIIFSHLHETDEND